MTTYHVSVVIVLDALTAEDANAMVGSALEELVIIDEHDDVVSYYALIYDAIKEAV